MATRPSTSRAASTSTSTMRACACGLRTKAAASAPAARGPRGRPLRGISRGAAHDAGGAAAGAGVVEVATPAGDQPGVLAPTDRLAEQLGGHAAPSRIVAGARRRALLALGGAGGRGGGGPTRG